MSECSSTVLHEEICYATSAPQADAGSWLKCPAFANTSPGRNRAPVTCATAHR